MRIETVVVGPIETNCYLVTCGDEVLVVDPGDDPGRILAALGDARVAGIVLTHRHWDHTGAVPALLDAYGVPLAAHRLDAPHVFTRTRQARWHDPQCRTGHASALERGLAPTRLLEGDDELTVGDCTFTVIHTPGHTTGSMCLYCAEEGVLLAGDTLFAGGRYGRTDFAEGSMESMLETLQTKFAALPGEVTVLSGHGPSSTLHAERNLNPYLR